jgi:hypothetical protein
MRVYSKKNQRKYYRKSTIQLVVLKNAFIFVFDVGILPAFTSSNPFPFEQSRSCFPFDQSGFLPPTDFHLPVEFIYTLRKRYIHLLRDQ